MVSCPVFLKSRESYLRDTYFLINKKKQARREKKGKKGALQFGMFDGILQGVFDAFVT